MVGVRLKPLVQGCLASYSEGCDDGMVPIIVTTTDPVVDVVGHKGAEYGKI